jgi:hypothetical protein
VSQAGYLLPDSSGTISFTTVDVPTVLVDFGVGPLKVDATNAITANMTAASDAASSAASASSSASSAASSAALVGAPAGSAIDAYLGGSAAKLVTGIPVDASNASGVDKTGATDSAAAIQAILDANAQAGDTGAQKVVRLQGIFKLSTTLVVKGSLDASNAVFNYTGSGVAVQVGSSAAGQLTRIHVDLGQIVCTTKPGTGWVAGTVGLRVTNVFRSNISYQMVSGFETGLHLLGDGTYPQGGVAYNTFRCGTLNNNKVNQFHSVSAVSGPFVNQNTFIGGSWAHAEGTYGANGQRHIVIGAAGSAISSNNNTWVNASLEGSTEEFIIECNGTDNLWLNCRYETTGHNPPIKWNELAARNLIIGGYQVDSITQTVVSGAKANNIIGAQSVDLTTLSDGGVVLSPFSGGSTDALTVMRSNWRVLGDTTAANYGTRINTSRVKLKNPTDTSDRLFIDAGNRVNSYGAGISTQKVTHTWGSGTPEGAITANVGSWHSNYSGSGFGHYQKMTGTGNTGWAAVGFQPFTTAARPAASLAGIGGTYFDTTLNKPGWSDGTSWRDATGTAI